MGQFPKVGKQQREEYGKVDGKYELPSQGAEPEPRNLSHRAHRCIGRYVYLPDLMVKESVPYSCRHQNGAEVEFK